MQFAIFVLGAVTVLGTRLRESGCYPHGQWWAHQIDGLITRDFIFWRRKRSNIVCFSEIELGLWCASDIQHLRAIVPLPFLPFFFALPHDGTQIQRIKNDLIRNLLTIWKFNFKFQNLSLSPCISRFYFHIQSDKSPPPPPSSREAFLRTCYHVKVGGKEYFSCQCVDTSRIQ